MIFLRMAITMGSLLMIWSSAGAEIYRYKDDTGQLHYVDDISSIPERYRNQTRYSASLPEVNIASPTAQPAKYAPPSKGEEIEKEGDSTRESAKIEIFVTSWCGYCKKLIAFLDSNGLKYSKYDIEQDNNANNIYKELGGGGVPLIRIGSSVIRGYNPDAVMQALKR